MMSNIKTSQEKVSVDIVKWSQNGQSVEVLNRQRLQTEVLPYVFEHSNYSSFTRQVTLSFITSLAPSANEVEPL